MKQKEFKNLKRHPNGDIIDFYPIHHLLSDKQVESLSDDDWSRWNEWQDEIRMMIYELRMA
jgi:hypothetical protein